MRIQCENNFRIVFACENYFRTCAKIIFACENRFRLPAMPRGANSLKEFCAVYYFDRFFMFLGHLRVQNTPEMGFWGTLTRK